MWSVIANSNILRMYIVHVGLGVKFYLFRSIFTQVVSQSYI